MSNHFTLDALREVANTDYANTEVEVDGENVVLLNPLQLPKEKREKLAEMQEAMEVEGADQVEVFGNVIRAVAEHDHLGEKLINAVGDNLALLVVIFNSYTKGTQAGEA